MITGQGICFAYDGVAALDTVDLAAHPGEVIGLIGPNGSGKSTLLRTLYGALRPHSGTVTLDQNAVTAMPPRDLARQIAVVVQEAAGDLPFTVADIVTMGRTPHLRSFQRPSPHDIQAVEDAIDRVGARHLLARVFSGLSGGEKQRVLIARALAQQTSHLLLDEPTNHLDIRYQHEILHLVQGLGVTTVVVLHDLNLAARYCDRLVLLHQGSLVSSGTPAQVLTPEVISAVYGIKTTRHDHLGTPQLLFAL